ncbi:hypothetical protein [Priestia sp. GS2]|uniref:hypothetical protein n=1 Tax=Priestia sp. GS2 TaxID=3117403 RepID=UPI002EDA612C
MSGTVREMRAIFTATMAGLRTAARAVRKEVAGIADETEKTTKRSNKSFEKLSATITHVEKQIEKAGDNKSFHELNRTLKASQKEFKETGSIGEKSIKDVEKAIGKAKKELASMTAEGIVEMNALEAAIHDVERELDSLNNDGLSTIANDAKRASNGLDDVRNSANHLRNEADELDTSLQNTNNTLIHIESSSRNSEHALDRLRETVMDVTTVGRALKLSLIGLAPAAVPAIASVTTATMGLVSSFGAASAGVAGFATVAIPSLIGIFDAQDAINKAQEKLDNATTEKQRIEAMEKLKSLQEALTDEQRRTLDALNDFTTYFEGLRKQFERPVFDIFTSSLKTLQRLLEMFTPVIDASVESVGNIIASFDQSLQTKDVESFFGFLAMRAGPALEAWSKSFGYILRGVGNLMVAFNDEGIRMEKGLVNLTKRFSEWADSLKESESFRTFLEYSNTNTPIFLEFMGNLWDILKNIMMILAPFGQVMLVALSGITGFIAKLTEMTKGFTQWEGFIPLVYGLATAFVTLKASMMFSSAATWILGLLNPMTRAMVLTQLWTKAQTLLNLSLFSNPIGLVVALLAGLTVGIIAAYKHSETFRNVVDQSWSAIKEGVVVAASVIGDVTSKMWDKALTSTDKMRESLSNKISEWGPALKEGFDSAVATTQTFFIEAGSSVAQLFGNGFVEQLKFAFTNLGGAASLVAPALAGMVLAFMGVTGPIGLVIAGIVSLIGFLYRLSQTNTNVANFFKQTWEGLGNTLNSVISALQPIIQVFKASFAEMAKELGPEFKKTVDVIKQSFSDLKPTFTEAGKAFGELAPVVNETVTQVGSAMAELAPLVFPIITEFISLWMDVQQTIWSAVFDIASTVLPLLINAFLEVFPLILKIISTVLPVVITLIGSLIPIVLELAKMAIPLILQVAQLVFPVLLKIVQSVLPIIFSLFQMLIPIILQLVNVLLPLILKVAQLVFPMVLKIVQSILPIVVNLLSLVAGIITNVLIPAIEFILKIVQKVFPVLMSIIKDNLNIIIGAIRLFSSILQGDWKGAWSAVQQILRSAWSIIQSILKLALDLAVLGIKTAWSNALKITSSIFTALWNSIKTIFENIVKSVSNYVRNIVDNIQNGWNTAKNKTIEIFNSIKTKVTSIFNELVEAAKKLPGRIGDGLKSMASKVEDGVKAVGNRMATGLEKVINTITQKGINAILKKMGVEKNLIPELNIPEFKRGGVHKGGPFIAGDGGEEELIRFPDGTMTLSPAKDTLYYGEKGTEILNGKETKEALKSIVPHYKTGLNRFSNGAKAIGEWTKDKAVSAGKATKKVAVAGKDKVVAGAQKVGDIVGDVWEYASNPKKLLEKVLSSLDLTLPKIDGSLAEFLNQGVSKVKDGGVDLLKRKFKELNPFEGGSSTTGPAGKGAARWRSTIIAAAARMNEAITEYDIQGVIAQIHRESGGNQNIVQSPLVRDINTRNGNPARGLLQYIPQTFRAYAVKGHNNIYSGYDQLLAFFNNTTWRRDNPRGTRGWGPRGRRKYEKGGIIQHEHLATVGEGGKAEVIIPLEQFRQRALQLFRYVGEYFGFDMDALMNGGLSSIAQELSSFAQQASSTVLNTKSIPSVSTSGYFDTTSVVKAYSNNQGINETSKQSNKEDQPILIELNIDGKSFAKATYKARKEYDSKQDNVKDRFKKG